MAERIDIPYDKLKESYDLIINRESSLHAESIKLGMHFTTLSKKFKKLGFKRLPNTGGMEYKERKYRQMALDYNNGETIEQVATKYGMSYTSAREKINRYKNVV